ncbi:lens fiber membrane intrinsic protein-like [Xenia sp. Carnegie-2017]|uniref:lens fiber membrane intrinsic protein-like n=1 Tax=Xenia sp. Carnegie-2017 TaxID=2897299 RepID=UPI001F03C535|nr:lens fiber membrane intrinsic protein-like [Xenia sp. Carnegie-2017]
MIKIIVTYVTSFVSILMLILAFATSHWNQHTIKKAGLNANQVHYHYEGLYERCFDVYENGTYVESKSNCLNLKVAAWNVMVMILLSISMFLFILAFVFAAIYSFYTRRTKYPIVVNCSLIGIAAVSAFIAMMIYTFKFWDEDIYFSWSYGAGWTTVAMALIGIVLIMADR